MGVWKIIRGCERSDNSRYMFCEWSFPLVFNSFDCLLWHMLLCCSKYELLGDISDSFSWKSELKIEVS